MGCGKSYTCDGGIKDIPYESGSIITKIYDSHVSVKRVARALVVVLCMPVSLSCHEAIITLIVYIGNAEGKYFFMHSELKERAVIAAICFSSVLIIFRHQYRVESYQILDEQHNTSE